MNKQELNKTNLTENEIECLVLSLGILNTKIKKNENRFLERVKEVKPSIDLSEDVIMNLKNKLYLEYLK